jgi:hypothetical protein
MIAAFATRSQIGVSHRTDADTHIARKNDAIYIASAGIFTVQPAR